MRSEKQTHLPGVASHKRPSSETECLGVRFDCEAHRRATYTERLKSALTTDRAFRKLDGFPVATDENILALSDPPYFTACPNPFLAEVIKALGTPYDPETDHYRREPFATDVSEGKKDVIYNAHSYHTKVPPRAIMRYLLHFTEPGDIVYDGFCGSGLTGVAAALCADRAMIEELGYTVTRDNSVLDESGKAFSKRGARIAILNDLAPAATFIAANYTSGGDAERFTATIAPLLAGVQEACAWMYKTKHPKTHAEAEIESTIWSDVFFCNACGKEVVFWDAALDSKKSALRDEFPCPHCKATLTKSHLEHVFESVYDPVTKAARQRIKQVPVELHCIGKKSGEEFVKRPDDDDLALIRKIESLKAAWHPVNTMLFKDGAWGDQWRKGYHSDVTHDYHFYLRRPLCVLADFYDRAKGDAQALFLLTGSLLGLTRLQRYSPGSTFPNMIRSGTLYIGSLHREWNVYRWLGGKARSLGRFFKAIAAVESRAFVATSSSTAMSLLPENSVDYVFVDPPFGDNLMYSELNFLWEGWLRVFTNQKPEAVISKSQDKDFESYATLMEGCFQGFYAALKPGRWMTVVFHNSQNAVWNAIQQALQRAGFVVADVRTIDKQQGSFNQIQAAGAVKKDLVISAYKPGVEVERGLSLAGGSEEGVWSFIRGHLAQLPLFVKRDGKAEGIAERQKHLLFDRMIAFHVERGVAVPVSASDFYAGLQQRFPERDGMYFLPEQVVDYDKKRMTVQEFIQLELLVSDEASAIQWLKQQLAKKPQTFQEVQPQFMREVAGWQKYEKPLELSELLSQNFLCFDGRDEVPSQIHSYLSSNFKELRNLGKAAPALKDKAKNRWYVPDPKKEADLEQLRHRALIREFQQYEETRGKLKVVRAEALRAGFKECWQSQDYTTIVQMAKRVPEAVIQEDPALLMYYDNALMRTEE